MIITAREQRLIEARAVEKGMTLLRLMETAGRSVFEHISAGYDIKGKDITVLSGNGGNGGDGFVAARLLKQAGARPLVVLCSGTPKANAPSQTYAAMISEGVRAVDLQFEWDRVKDAVMNSVLIVDAVYGIGFRGELNEDMAKLFSAVNESAAAVFAVDVPSGVNADTGLAAKDAVIARETLCFIAKKCANVLKSAAVYCGQTHVDDLGIPADCFIGAGGSVRELNRPVAAGILKERPAVCHKGSFGRLLMVVGSERYRGAAVIAALGAYGAGAGLVTVASVEKALAAVAASVPEAVLIDSSRIVEGLPPEAGQMNACLIGCGLGVSGFSAALLNETIINTDCPLVIDADGLNLLALDGAPFEKIRHRAVLTPHVGEFSRLSGLSADEILSDRIKHAAAYARARQVVLVLKSENTLAAFPGGQVFVNTAGNSGLAKAGSGDLLSGIIAALSAMGKSLEEAALGGIWLHSLAADIAERRRDRHSLTASYIAEFISEAYRETYTGSVNESEDR